MISYLLIKRGGGRGSRDGIIDKTGHIASDVGSQNGKVKGKDVSRFFKG